jgi:hypothetical protein
MSEITQELPKKTVMAWRAFLATPEGQYGIDWLRRNRVLGSTGDTDIQLVAAARDLKGYWEALGDIEDRLTKLPEAARSLDEPPLGVGRDDT